MGKMDWVTDREKERDEEFAKGFFQIQEGDNRVQLLTHCEPLAQVWDNTEKKYRIAEEGDSNISIKGVCYVLQDGVVKQAKLPYTVVKAIKALMEDEDYAFEGFPMPRLINIKAKGAGTKEVDYAVTPAPKETSVSEAVIKELATKPSPEEIVEKLRGKVSQRKNEAMDIPEGDMPF